MSAAQICRIGAAVALLSVSAMVTVPLGPVPFTLQTLVLAMLPPIIGGRGAVSAVGLYLLVGSLGLPVFSGFSGGVGQLIGPTGGFLWGFLLGTALGVPLLRLRTLPESARHAICAVVMLATSYALGTAQLAAYLSVSLPAAALSAVVPFVLPDIIKLGIGVATGLRVRHALGGPSALTSA